MIAAEQISRCRENWRIGRRVVVREVSASSSFRRLILSFKPSASRLAAVILACICSPDISAAIFAGQGPLRKSGGEEGGGGREVEGPGEGGLWREDEKGIRGRGAESGAASDSAQAAIIIRQVR